MANKDFDQVWEHVDKKAPAAQWQIVSVTFATAGIDVEVPHRLLPQTAEGIDYTVLRRSAPCTIYHDGSPTRTGWQSSYLLLRSNIPCKVDLLLTVADDGGGRELPEGSISTSTIIGSGTTGAIPKWSSAFALTDSIITEGSSTITIAGRTTINTASAANNACRFQVAGVTVGGVGASGWAKGTSADDLGFFAETGRGMKWMINGSANDAMILHASGGFSIGTTTDPGANNVNLATLAGFGWGDRSAQLVGSSGASGYLRFDTNGTERARIDATGALALTTSASLGYTLNGTGANGTYFLIQRSGSARTYLGSSILISGSSNDDTDLYASGDLRLVAAGGDITVDGIPQFVSGRIRVRKTTAGVANVAKMEVENDNAIGHIGITSSTYNTGRGASTDPVNVAGTLQMWHDTRVLIASPNGSVEIYAGGNATPTRVAYFGSTAVECAVTLQPTSDNAMTCGASGKRWTEVWAVNGTIQTSDAADKRHIQPSDLGSDFILSLRSRKYVMNDEPDGHWRHGFLAQEVMTALRGRKAHGMVAGAPGSYGLNYAAFIPALVATVQELDARLSALEN